MPGLTLSGAAALSHDLWVSVHRKGDAPREEQLMVARVATVALAVVAIVLGILFKGQNVAFMVGLAFAVAAPESSPTRRRLVRACRRPGPSSRAG